MAEIIPFPMSAPVALDHIRELAQETNRIVVINHGQQRSEERHVTRPQIVKCLRAGFIVEGPFQNSHGNWQVTMAYNHAGDQITVVVAIEWATRLLVITVF
jgi:hypothetical protein